MAAGARHHDKSWKAQSRAGRVSCNHITIDFQCAEPNARSRNIFTFHLYSDPSATKTFRCRASHVTARKWIQNNRAFICYKLDEKLGQSSGKARGMCLISRLIASPNIFRITLIVATLDKTRWNCTTMVVTKLGCNDMSAWPLLRFVTALEESLHVGAVIIEDVSIVGFWEWLLAEPPNVFNSVFHALPTDRYPFSGRRKFCRIVPKTFLRKMKTDVLAKHQQHFEVVKRSCRTPGVVTASDVQNETAFWFQDSPNFLPKRLQPINVFRFGNVAVFLFELQRVGWRRDYD